MSETPSKPYETRPEPCEGCPWRASNRDKPHAHGWYTVKNLRRLWRGFRTGLAPGMTCHESDPNVERPPGDKAPPDGAVTMSCAGAALLVQRELGLLNHTAGHLGAYRGWSRNGLTREGVAYRVSRAILGGSLLVPEPRLTVVGECADIERPGVAAAPFEKRPGCLRVAHGGGAVCNCLAPQCPCEGACERERAEGDLYCSGCAAWRRASE